jgi:hypothetical protein
VAYWDPDTRPEGWDDDHHVMSANQGWITINFVGSAPTESAGSGFTDEGRSIDAVEAAIAVDGDAADWADVEGLDMSLKAIMDETIEPHDATLKVAHDGENVYVLFQVEDDYNWDPADAHLSAAAAVQWAIDPGAGEGMGSTDADRETSLGMVDLWHWELECAAGEDMGGAVSDAGDGDLGNDAGCNFDDEWALATEDREDDNADGAENSLLGVWSHSEAVVDENGTWTFEMSRPLDTGDSTDAQFAVGSDARVAVAYWDPDTRPEGWDDDHHVMSANQGWITIRFV